MSVSTDMHIMLIIFMLLAGFSTGSFFTVVGMRIPRGESINHPKFSYCETCNRTLKWFELIPVLSWFILGGKCYKCKTKLSFIYPVIEFFTGVLFLATYLTFGITVEGVFFLLMVSLLIIISISDSTYGVIPNKILKFFAVFTIPLSFFTNFASWQEQLIGFLVLVGLIIFILLFSKGNGMGGGDIKLFALLSITLGWKYFLIGFMLCVIVGFAYGTVKMIVKKDNVIRFGPFIAIGYLLTFFYYEEILNWYLKIFGL